MRPQPIPARNTFAAYRALGAAEAKSPKGKRIHDSFVFGSLSMAAYGWGM